MELCVTHLRLWSTRPSTAKLRPISSLQNSSYFGRVHLGLLVSIFWGRISFFSFAPRLSKASQHVHKMWHQKWARHRAPFLEPMGTISAVVLEQASMKLGGQNWVPQKHKLIPKFLPIIRPLLIPFAYRVMLFQNRLIQPACQVSIVSIFLGRISFFSFAPRLSKASQLVHKMWHHQWARHRAPFLEPQCGTDPTISAHDPHTGDHLAPVAPQTQVIEVQGRNLSGKTSPFAFVRDFLQNSIGNFSTSTTCNPIYSEGMILEVQITMEYHRQLIHQHHLQSHLQCGNDPIV